MPEKPKKVKGYAADDELDLILVERVASLFSNKTIHPDLLDAPIRRLDEPYPMETTSCGVRG